jgi:hypothetical protein
VPVVGGRRREQGEHVRLPKHLVQVHVLHSRQLRGANGDSYSNWMTRVAPLVR